MARNETISATPRVPKNPAASILLLSFLLVLKALPVHAMSLPPKSWMVGFNEEFANESIPNNLPNMPGNVSPHTLANFNATVLDLASHHHVGVYRDIISIEMLAPTGPNDKTYWNALQAELEMFKGYNLNLVLAFGSPLPAWMTSQPWCFIPSSPSQWSTLKDNMGFTIGNWLAGMAAADPSLAAWMKTNLFIDGFNEFDSEGSMINGQCVVNQGTGALAADLEDGIATVLKSNNLSAIQLLMPSMATGNVPYLTQYYASGGVGYPNVHIYFPTNQSNAAILSSYERTIANYKAALPSNMQNSIFVTETGAPSQTSTCTTGMTESNRAALYSSILSDTNIMSPVVSMIFWRLEDLPPNQVPTVPCESSYGAINLSGSYMPSTQSIFSGIIGLE